MSFNPLGILLSMYCAILASSKLADMIIGTSFIAAVDPG